VRRGGWINGIGSRRCEAFLSIDLTTIIATLLNTLILFLVLKHFLFDKVNKVIEDRKNDVKETYRQADEAKENAEKLEAEYTSRLEGAKEESAQIIQTATRKAQQRSDEIMSEARLRQRVLWTTLQERSKEKRRSLSTRSRTRSPILLSRLRRQLWKRI